jgi:hypothetical protein
MILVYWCICGSVNEKASFGVVTKQKTPSEKNCLRVFFQIFVNQLSVERNHSLSNHTELNILRFADKLDEVLV